MNYTSLLFSKLIDSNDPGVLKRHNIERSDMPTDADKRIYDFITSYAEQNRGQAPSYATMVGEFSDFTYVEQVSDGYEYLTRQIKSQSAKLALKDLIENKLSEAFAKTDGNILLDDLIDDLKSIKIDTNIRSQIGTNIKTDTDAFLDEYRRRKSGDSFKIWRSKFPLVNEQIGGYLSGNLYTWYGRSGRGKSVFTMEEAIESAFQGANVLIWALEMSKFEWMARAYSSISAREGLIVDKINGVDYEVGFENKALLMGGLDEEFEAAFEIFLATINEKIPGNIIVRAVDDEDFYQRGVKQLEADIIQTKADVVVIDPIYYLDYEANTSKTAGGDVANTSKKLRHIAGYTKSVIHVITQAEEVRDDTDEDGNRELRPPKRAEIKKTKAVLEDAANTFGIDTLDGEGIIEIGKGRNGGEGTRVNVLYLPNYGIVRQMDTGEEAASQFDF